MPVILRLLAKLNTEQITYSQLDIIVPSHLTPKTTCLTFEFSYYIWILHTPCGRFKKRLQQGECEFQVDKLIWHF